MPRRCCAETLPQHHGWHQQRRPETLYCGIPTSSSRRDRSCCIPTPLIDSTSGDPQKIKISIQYTGHRGSSRIPCRQRARLNHIQPSEGGVAYNPQLDMLRTRQEGENYCQTVHHLNRSNLSIQKQISSHFEERPTDRDDRDRSSPPAMGWKNGKSTTIIAATS